MNIKKWPCLAIVVKARVFNENVGRIVEVKRPIVDGEIYHTGNQGERKLMIQQPDMGPFWLIESQGGFLTTMNFRTKQPELVQCGVASDYALRPLNEDDGESDERETGEEGKTKSPASVQG